jgi:hypothetical protein
MIGHVLFQDIFWQSNPSLFSVQVLKERSNEAVVPEWGHPEWRRNSHEEGVVPGSAGQPGRIYLGKQQAENGKDS